MIAILMGSSHAAVAICCVYTNHSCTQIMDISNHRRRIKIEEKAKYVGSVWGEEFIQFLAELAVLNCMDDLNYRMNCTRMI